MTRDEWAQGYVLGSLSPLERQEVARARLCDPDLDSAIADLELRLAPLTGFADTVAPPADLFDRIASAIDTEAAELAGKTALACEDGEWVPYLPGLELKRLWTPRTVMLRCRPGAVLPAHAHAEHEHIIVVSGDFQVGGRTFRTGDYHGSPPGTDHGEARTSGGCLLLIQRAA